MAVVVGDERAHWVHEARHLFLGVGTHRAPRPSSADVGVDQIRNRKLQMHACAHKRVSVFTVINHFFRTGLGEAFDRLRAR